MRVLACLSAMAVLLNACVPQPPLPEQDPAGVEKREPEAIRVEPVPVVPVQPEPLRPNPLGETKDPRSILSTRNIYFDYNSFVIKDEFQLLLAAHGKFLAANPKVKMLIQGNADERGSREYNVALGQSRASAVRRALLLLGARDEQLEAVSLGKETPVCGESTEACWARNRRADMLYSGEF